MSKFYNKTYLEKLVKDTLQKQIQEYQTEHILGTWLVGDARYHYCQEEDEPILITIYFPSFTECCLKQPFWEEKEENKILIDIRYYYDAIKKFHNFGLEMLYSHYYEINPLFSLDYQKTVYQHRDIIGLYCPKKRLEKAYQKAIAAAAEKKDFEVLRIYTAAKLYHQGRSLDECFTPTDISIRDLFSSVQSGFTKINSEAYLTEIKKWIDETPSDTDFKAGEVLQKDILHLIKTSFDYQKASESTIKIKLTENEENALTAIQKTIDGLEGVIKISQLSKETNISRPVFNNLLQKLKENNLAEVTNNGSKGTTVKLFKENII